MKSAILLTLIMFLCSQSYAEPENEIPTQAEFEKSVKEAKSSKGKGDPIPSAADMLKNPKAHAGKKYYLWMYGEKVHGFGCKKKPKPFCEMNYLTLDDGGMGKKVGQGLYSLECYEKKVCTDIENNVDNKGDTEMVVEMVNIVQMTDSEGKTRTAPLLKVIRLID